MANILHNHIKFRLNVNIAEKYNHSKLMKNEAFNITNIKHMKTS